MAVAPTPRFTWTKDYHLGWILMDDFKPIMRVYEVPTQRSFRWGVEPWSGNPPEDPPTFYTLVEAKTYCEVTAKLCAF